MNMTAGQDGSLHYQTGSHLLVDPCLKALENMHDADVELICKLARKNDQTTLGQAMCWTTLMDILSGIGRKLKSGLRAANLIKRS